MRNRDTDKGFWLVVVMCGLFAVAIAFCLSSCTTARLSHKATKSMVKLYAKDSIAGDNVALLFCHISIDSSGRIDTVYGDPQVVTNEVVQHDTVRSHDSLFITTTITRTLSTVQPWYITKRLTVTNNTEIDKYRLEAQKTSKERDLYKAKFEGRGKYVWGAWITWVALLLIIVLAIIWFVRTDAQHTALEAMSKMNRNG